MPQFLFVAEVPPSKALSSSPGYPHEWTLFANDANTILKPVKACKRLQLNARLLPVEGSWPALERLAANATTHGFSYSIVLVDGAEILTLDVKTKS